MLVPLRFRPLIKRTRWGGSRLGSVLGKTIGEEDDYAESWEVSDCGSDQSVVDGGPFDGKTISEIVSENNAELFGRHAGLQQFPLLVKFLDASDRLSVQVHPNDAQAELFEPGENGKTESWVIIDAEPGAVIYAGLKKNVDRVQFQRHLAEGTLAACLQTVEVQAGDCFLVPSGTVHAIGEGILLAEVQQTSDLTFRLHDWDRVGTDGRQRELHIEKSLQCIDFSQGPLTAVTPQPIVDFREDFSSAYQTVELISCPYFVLHRHCGAAPFTSLSGNCFHTLITLEGNGHLVHGQDSYSLSKGESVLIPAACGSFQVVPDGEMTVLDAFLPEQFVVSY